LTIPTERALTVQYAVSPVYSIEKNLVPIDDENGSENVIFMQLEDDEQDELYGRDGKPITYLKKSQVIDHYI
jgi:hypothetical protein